MRARLADAAVRPLLLAGLLGLPAAAGRGQGIDLAGLSTLQAGRVRLQNSLWIETPLARGFRGSKEVVVADLEGPAIVTMIHFALPQQAIASPEKYHLGRDLLIRMYWDGEREPSVDCPFVDFFCDPAGRRERIDTALVNKRRGYNAYFPMPFRTSARIVLLYQGEEPPGPALWRKMPCYGYVMVREVDAIGPDEGSFHAQWRQAAVLIGKEDYVALEARGRGKFVGWNVTVRRPGMTAYPVDMNEKFSIDGEAKPSVEFMGIEDAFGFSWGFPPTENLFPLTGSWPFLKGAAAYRFFLRDAISFARSLRVTIGFGEKENPIFRRQFSRPGTKLQISTTCYWYQAEPHAPFPPLPGPAARAPAPDRPFWPDEEPLPSIDALRTRGVRLHLRCGRPAGEVILAEPGFAAEVREGYAYAGWPLPVYHSRAGDEEVRIDLRVPARAAGTLRIFVVDPDRFQGGRRERILVDDRELGVFEGFEEGRWIEARIDPAATADGALSIRAVNLAKGSNAVISIVEWVAARR